MYSTLYTALSSPLAAIFKANFGAKQGGYKSVSLRSPRFIIADATESKSGRVF